MIVEHKKSLLDLTWAKEETDIEVSFVDDNHSYPICVNSSKIKDASDWMLNNKELVEVILEKHGALLLRGFKKYDIAEFEYFINQCFGKLLNYQNRSTPRTRISGHIYTSTEYPASECIPQHNENSYSHEWPKQLFFLCITAPQSGGQTPVTDSRIVYDKIPNEIREKFEKLGIMYVRNLSDKIGLSWQEVFQMSDRTQVKKYCANNNIDCEWVDSTTVRIKQILPAVRFCHSANRKVWFNQAHLFHVSALPPDIAESLGRQYDPMDMPRNAFYGDGSGICLDELEQIRCIYNKEQAIFTWKEGDILILNNLLVAHGRKSYSGNRKIAVGMV